MGKYRAYSEYKDSGNPWIGACPSAWKLSALKHFCITITDGSHYSPKAVDSGFPYVTVKDVVDGGVDLYNSKRITEEDYLELARGGCAPQIGDVLFSKDGTIGKVAIVDHDGFVILSSLAIVRPDQSKMKSKYLYYLLESNSLVSQISSHHAGAALKRITLDVIVDLYALSPSLKEQTKIANFLDRETAKIDKLIAKQGALIELLKEKRQAVISHAVTKGLDPDAPMKDSGVEWLGEIPAHWDVKRAKHLLKFVTSGSRGWAQYYADEGDLFFRIGNLTRDGIYPDLSDVQKVAAPVGAEGERSRVCMNDLLISITADLGSTAVATEEVVGGYVSQHVALARPSHAIHSAKWFAFALISDAVKNQFWSGGYGGTKVQLSLEDVRELRVAVPNEQDQVALVEFVESKLDQMDELIKKAVDTIQLLQERRTALISAAVIGKIDVREEV